MRHVSQTPPLRGMTIGTKGHVIHRKDLDDGGYVEDTGQGLPQEAERQCSATLIHVDDARQILEVTCKCGEVIVVDCETARSQ